MMTTICGNLYVRITLINKENFKRCDIFDKW